ncbi:MAG: hypothetical protein IT355_21030 [Gemmatimonadaceae bacterium]|nr:hypothetical protein [Gemmatimonadaceae bacterium]
MRSVVRLSLLLGAVGSALGAQATLDSTTIGAMRWRAIGPANMGGRITDVEGIPSPSKTFYVATAGGGIWKTTNAGTTFRPIFENQRCVAMGDLAIAPSDTNIIYAGTGEQNSRNSISPGCGVFKSTDGGRTWNSLGLAETEHIGRIQVHPRDPNTVYMAVLGSAWKASRARGLYKSTDGGTSWTVIKFISDRAGFIDVQLDPTNPDIVWASSYERMRGPYFLQSGGPGSALWKSTDAGATFTKVSGGGFPASTLGRIEIAIARSNPRIMYTMLEADTLPNAVKDATKKPQEKLSGLYRSEDGGATWVRTNKENVRPFYYSQVRVDPRNPDRVYFSSTPVKVSDDGGKTARDATQGIHVDHHAMWIDPADPEHIVVGNDGGVAQTWDRGGNYDALNIINIGQFYAVSYDMQVPYRVCGGLQDNGSWCGPSRRVRGQISNENWVYISGGDGFYTANDPTDPDIVYSESQGGSMGRLNMSTGERTSLAKPSWRPGYMQLEDSILVERGDTTKPETPAQRRRIAAFRARQVADSVALDLRWNWNTPFFLSAHNPSVFYAGANRVVKSTQRGDNLVAISPDLSQRDTMKIRVSTKTTGGITLDATGAETFGTITALNESPIRPGLLYAGTDDGNVWLTRNDGATWERIPGTRFPGLAAESYVSRIEPSHHDSSTFFITFDDHRRGNFTPYVYVTRDFGASFTSLAATLPTGGPDFVHVIREDPVNPDLLFLGTDVGAYVSMNRGQSWQKFMTGLPTVPVHDLQIHPRDRELIAGTHGRAIYVVDIAPLQQMTPAIASKKVYLFAPRTSHALGQAPDAAGSAGGGNGHKRFVANSPAYGAEITYRIAEAKPGTRVQLVITDAAGDTMRTLTGPGGAGVHRVMWDLRGKRPPAKPLSPAERRDSARTMVRVAQIFDSLQAAGMDSNTVRFARTAMLSGRTAELIEQFMGAAGGAGGAQVPGLPRFAERPGEGAAGAGGRGGAGGAPGAGGAGAPPAAGGPPGMGAMQQIFGAFRGMEGSPLGRGARGGAGGPLVKTGEYLVTLTYGDERQRQVLRVERPADMIGVQGFGGQDDDEEHDASDDGHRR